MDKIRIKNFGPIKEGCQDNDGWIEIKKVTVFTGNQGSGKSTVAKLISTCTWIEKALVRGDIKSHDLAKDTFRSEYCAYQNIHSFFKKDTKIEYSGKAYSFVYKGQKFELKKKDRETNGYLLPKIMYVPAERNFVSAVAQPEKLKYLPRTLSTFLEEFIRSNEEIENSIELPINDLQYKFDSNTRAFNVIGNDYELALSEASSGIQSVIPLFLVSQNLANSINNATDFSKDKMSVEEKKDLSAKLLNILTNKATTEALKRMAVKALSNITENDCFINIVEEPEQNLFPTSQQKILNSLLSLNNINEGNKLIMTTHSPYLINFLTLAVKAHSLKINTSDKGKKEKLNSLFPLKSTINDKDLIIYELDEIKGTIKILPSYKGLPSDDNELNEQLDESNEVFAQLLEFQQTL